MAPQDFIKKARLQSVYHIYIDKNSESQAPQDYVLKKDNGFRGMVSLNSMKNLNLFDTIKTTVNGFSRITFSGKDWDKKMSGADLDIDIQMEGNRYTIIDKKAKNTEIVSGWSFNKGQRQIHSVKSSSKKYYLVGISDATMNNEDSENRVTFFVVRLEPELTTTFNDTNEEAQPAPR